MEQSPTTSFQIRAPFDDELPRVLQQLSPGGRPQHARVAVAGRVERIAAAAALYLPEDGGSGFLRFTPAAADLAPSLVAALLRPLAAEAGKEGASAVYLIGSVASDHPLNDLLQEAGFECYRQTELYQMDAAALLDRLERIYQRLVDRDLIPGDARAIVPRGAAVPKLRAFLAANQRSLAERLETEEGFTLEHSLVLLVGAEVKGVFFTRNHGVESYAGLMLVAAELRGAVGWANTFLSREMLRFGMQNGVERFFFEVHPDDHRGSYQIAHSGGATLLYRRSHYRRQWTADASESPFSG